VTEKAAFKKYRMNERGTKPRKVDEKLKKSLRRGKPRTPSKEFT
jgi:hypothetical protein